MREAAETRGARAPEGAADRDARELFLDSLFVMDGHCDTVLDLVGLSLTSGSKRARDFFRPGSGGQVDFEGLRAGRVGCQIFALFTDEEFLPRATEHSFFLLETMEALFGRKEGLVLARNREEILGARRGGRIAALLSLEGGEAIGEDLGLLRAFHERGLSLMGLTWNRRNAIARGAGTGTAADGRGGLTAFGRRVIREMERLGMGVDVSHLSDEALEEVLAVTERPLFASHSNSRSLCPHRRNLTDAQAEAIAATGGLVGLTFAGLFIDPDPARVTKERFLEHLEHFLALLGPDHVGLGSDFDGFSPAFGQAFETARDLPWIARALLERGRSPELVAKVMGGNWLRLIGELCG